MSIKRKTYSAEFKAKLVLEVLKEEKTINEIASEYGMVPKNFINWKKEFLENMSWLLPWYREPESNRHGITPTRF